MFKSYPNLRIGIPLIAVFVFVILLLVQAFTFYLFYNFEREQAISKLKSDATVLSLSLDRLKANNKINEFEDIVKNYFSNNENILFFDIQWEDGKKILKNKYERDFQNNPHIKKNFKITQKGTDGKEILGEIQIYYSKNSLNEKLENFYLIYFPLEILIGTLLITFLIFFTINHRINMPYKTLCEEIEKFAEEAKIDHLTLSVDNGWANLIGDLNSYIDVIKKEMEEKDKLVSKQKEYSETIEEIAKEKNTKFMETNQKMIENNKKLEEINKNILEEINLAKKIHLSILPKVSFDDVSLMFGIENIALKQVSGDFYDIYKLTEEKTVFLIADASGVGVPAALISTMTKIAISAHSKPERSSAEICKRVNDELCNIIAGDELYITMLMVIFDSKEMTIDYTNAGHTNGYLINKMSGSVVEIADENNALGIAKEINLKNNIMKVTKESRLVLITDGVINTKNPEGKIFGATNIEKILQEKKDETSFDLPKIFMTNLNEYSDYLPAEDDKTIIVIDFDKELLEEGKSGTDIETETKSEENIDEKKIKELLSLGRKSYKKNETDKALEQFEEAIKLDENNYEGYYYLGSIYKRNKEYEKAKENFEKALEIKSDEKNLMNNLGLIYYYLKEYEKAIDIWEKSLKIDSNQEKISENVKKLKSLMN